MLEFCENIVDIEEAYLEEKEISLVLKYAEHGSLFDLILEQDSFMEKEVRTIMGQLLLALNYMHRNVIIHRDMKPANILVLNKKNLNVCIADLGLSTRAENISSASGGTPGYIAPELFKGVPYTYASDIFSLGVIFFNMLTCSNLFDGHSSREVYKLNKNIDAINLVKEANLKVSPLCMDLLFTMLQKDPK
jgi:serine/threonine protein kinase